MQVRCATGIGRTLLWCEPSAHDPAADQLVDLVGAGGEHEHVDGRRLVQAAADLDAIEAGEHHIEDNEVGAGSAGAGGGAIEGALHAEALGWYGAMPATRAA